MLIRNYTHSLKYNKCEKNATERLNYEDSGNEGNQYNKKLDKGKVKHIKKAKKTGEEEDSSMDNEEEKHNDDEHGTFIEVIDELDNLEKEKRTETTTAIVKGYPANYKLEDLGVKI